MAAVAQLWFAGIVYGIDPSRPLVRWRDLSRGAVLCYAPVLLTIGARFVFGDPMPLEAAGWLLLFAGIQTPFIGRLSNVHRRGMGGPAVSRRRTASPGRRPSGRRR